MAEQRLYDYTNQRESGGSQNLYWGNHSKQVTEDELRELYNADDNARLRESFGTFENYLAYMNERQDLIDSGEYKADWWDTGVALVDEGTLADREAGMDDKGFERSVIEEGARQGEIGYNEQADVFQSLYTKYTGEETTKYLDNGAKYEWNGSSFVLTQEAYGMHFGSIVPYIIASGVASVAAAPIAQSLGAKMGAALGLGEAGTAALTAGLTNGLGTLGSTALTGGDLTSGDFLVDFLWGSLSPTIISQLGITPDTFASAFVDSFGEDLLRGALTDAGFDWKEMLVDAAVQGGLTSAKDFIHDWLSTKDKDDLYQHYLQSDPGTFVNMTPEEFDNWLLTSPDSLLNTSDLGGLVGPQGLLTQVFGFEGTADYVSTAWFDSGVDTVTSFLGSLGVDKALSAITSLFPEGEEDPFYGKGDPYIWDPEMQQWVLNGHWTAEEIDRWNQEFLYGGALDERYWHSWQERDPNSTVQGIWETAQTPETGGIGGFFKGLIGTGGGLKISDSALPGTGVPDPDGMWATLINAWNDLVDNKSAEEQANWAASNGIEFTDDPKPPVDPFAVDSADGVDGVDVDGLDDDWTEEVDDTNLLVDSVTGQPYIGDFNFVDPFTGEPIVFPPQLGDDGDDQPPSDGDDDWVEEIVDDSDDQPPELGDDSDDQPPELGGEGGDDEPPSGGTTTKPPQPPRRRRPTGGGFQPASPIPVSAGASGEFPLVARSDFPIVDFLFGPGGAYSGGVPGMFEGMF